MDRKIINYLKKWKESFHRKPLILQGARQVGKTYSILEFYLNSNTIFNYLLKTSYMPV